MSISHSIIAGNLLPSSVAGVSRALGVSAHTVRAALYRGIKAGLFVRLAHGHYGLGPASDAEVERANTLAAAQAMEVQRRVAATWPMDAVRHAAAVRAYDAAVGRRLTGAMAIDTIINALRFGVAPD